MPHEQTPTTIDVREEGCGVIPRMQERLAETGEPLAFVILRRMVPQALSALASGTRYDVRVDEVPGEPDAALLTFTPLVEDDDPLSLF